MSLIYWHIYSISHNLLSTYPLAGVPGSWTQVLGPTNFETQLSPGSHALKDRLQLSHTAKVRVYIR